MIHDDVETEATTESLTDITARKIRHFKTELFSLFLFLLGVVTAVDPHILAQVLGPNYGPYALIASAIAMFLLRRYTSTPAEPFRKPKA